MFIGGPNLLKIYNCGSYSIAGYINKSNVNRFEKAHGTIKDYEQPPIPINFGPTGEA